MHSKKQNTHKSSDNELPEKKKRQKLFEIEKEKQG